MCLGCLSMLCCVTTNKRNINVFLSSYLIYGDRWTGAPKLGEGEGPLRCALSYTPVRTILKKLKQQIYHVRTLTLSHARLLTTKSFVCDVCSKRVRHYLCSLYSHTAFFTGYTHLCVLEKMTTRRTYPVNNLQVLIIEGKEQNFYKPVQNNCGQPPSQRTGAHPLKESS